jgi:hypothetical protein
MYFNANLRKRRAALARASSSHAGVIADDTSCTDHMVAWRIRNALSLDGFGQVGGVSGDPKRPDNIVFDITPNASGGTGISKGGFGHPACLNNPGPFHAAAREVLNPERLSVARARSSPG